jgi:signal transduction histidine kinase
MRRLNLEERRLTDYGVPIAVGATVIAVVSGAFVVVSAPAHLWLGIPGTAVVLPPGLGSVVAAAVLALAGWRLTATSEDAGFSVLVVACVLAGVGAHDVARLLSAPLTANPYAAPAAGLRLALVVAYLNLFGLSLLVAGIWAAAPKRALGSWVGPLAGLFFLWTAISAALRAQGPSPLANGSAADLSAIWRSGLLLAAVWVVGAMGALRAAALESLAAGRPVAATRANASGQLLVWVAALAAGAGVVAVLARALAIGDLALVAGPLLWLLIALVALRWSTTVAWMAMAVSLTMAATVALEVSAVAGWALLVAATLAGWSSLVSAVPGPNGSVGVTGRGIALVVTAMAGLPLFMGGDGTTLVAMVWVPAPGFPIEALWTPALVFGPVAFAVLIVLRRRLVPAIAEAEAVAGEPFAPSRYVAVLASEALTEQARVRAQAAEAERRRLASDLHADVLPGLARAAADTEAGADPDTVRARLRAVESEVRGLLAERRHVVLEELGLVEALEWLAGRAEEGGELEATVEVDPATTDARPPLAVERAAFRVAQLAVDNAVRHAQARRLSMSVLVTTRAVQLAIDDDGRGFDAAHPATGFGLTDMHVQAAEAGARVEVASTPGDGTRVTFVWPR